MKQSIREDQDILTIQIHTVEQVASSGVLFSSYNSASFSEPLTLTLPCIYHGRFKMQH